MSADRSSGCALRRGPSRSGSKAMTSFGGTRRNYSGLPANFASRFFEQRGEKSVGAVRAGGGAEKSVGGEEVGCVDVRRKMRRERSCGFGCWNRADRRS